MRAILIRSRSVQHGSYEQIGRYLKFFSYLYCLGWVSPHVFVVLSRMQFFLVISVRLVGVIITCVVYFIVALDIALFYLGKVPCLCCYLRLVVLIVPFWCRDYRKRIVIG